ncbi:MAG: DUF2644 domain-containing protein [Tannerellaceae bacterium]
MFVINDKIQKLSGTASIHIFLYLCSTVATIILHEHEYDKNNTSYLFLAYAHFAAGR